MPATPLQPAPNMYLTAALIGGVPQLLNLTVYFAMTLLGWASPSGRIVTTPTTDILMWCLLILYLAIPGVLLILINTWRTLNRGFLAVFVFVHLLSATMVLGSYPAQWEYF